MKFDFPPLQYCVMCGIATMSHYCCLPLSVCLSIIFCVMIIWTVVVARRPLSFFLWLKPESSLNLLGTTAHCSMRHSFRGKQALTECEAFWNARLSTVLELMLVWKLRGFFLFLGTKCAICTLFVSKVLNAPSTEVYF